MFLYANRARRLFVVIKQTDYSLLEIFCFCRHIKYHLRLAEVVKQFPVAETCFFLLIINGLIFLELRKSSDLASVSPLICNASILQSYRGLFRAAGYTISYLPPFLNDCLSNKERHRLGLTQIQFSFSYLMIITLPRSGPNLIFLLFPNSIKFI